jgi:hypothetical protein
MMEQSKVCITCEVEKPPGSFYADHRMRDGRLNRCKACCVAASQQSRDDRRAARVAVPMRDRQIGINGDMCEDTLTTRRDQYIILLAAACDRYRQAEDHEDRDGAREALIFRCRQLLEAEGLVST